MAAKTLTTAELADELGTTPRTLRKFLRSDQGPGRVGKGARYELKGDARSLATMKKKFAGWVEATEAAKAAKAAETDNEDDATESDDED